MKQTKKHSKGLRLLSAVLALVMALSLLPLSVFAEERTQDSPEEIATMADSKYRIVHLDCGRKYFSVENIEKLIDTMVKYGYNQLQLAFGNGGCRFLLDDMSLSFDNVEMTSDTVKTNITKGNNSFNGDTRYLSESEMDEIITYANMKGIEIVPMLNMPGHATAIVYNTSYSSNGNLNVADEAARNYGYALLGKYVEYFKGKGCKFFHFGSDESGYTGTNMTTFLTGCAKVITDAGMTPRAFNDATNVATMPTSVQITYWHQESGSKTASALANAGYGMINTHGRWYYVIKTAQNSEIGTKYWQGTVNTTATSVELPVMKAEKMDNKWVGLDEYFDGNPGYGSTISNSLGTMFCIWCDASQDAYLTDSDVISENENYGALYQLEKLAEHYWPEDINKGGTTTKPVITLEDGKDVPSQITVGDSFTLVSDKSVTWTTNNPDVIDLLNPANSESITGTSVTALAKGSGEATITATDADVNAVSYTITVNASVSDTIQNVTIKVGESKTFDVDGSVSAGSYITDDKQYIATATVEQTKTEGTVSYDPATLAEGTFYVSNKANDTSPTQQLTIEKADTGYYIKNAELGYFYPNATYKSMLLWGSWSYSLKTKDMQEVSIESLSSNRIQISKSITSGRENTTAYLTFDGTNFGSARSGTNIYLYTKTETPAVTTSKLTITGTGEGETSVKIGSVTYNIKVTAPETTETKLLNYSGSFALPTGAEATVEGTGVTIENGKVVAGSADATATVTAVVKNEGGYVTARYIYNVSVSAVDHSDVDPLSVELWVTNRYAGGTHNGTTYDATASGHIVSVSADDAYGVDGVLLETLVPTTGTDEGDLPLLYWKGTRLSASNKQTYTGTDMSGKGNDFLKVRYYEDSWQYLYNGTWTNVLSTDQIIAYYMQVYNTSPEIVTAFRDYGGIAGQGGGEYDAAWFAGYRGVGTAVVYSDKSMSPDGDTGIWNNTLICYYESASGGHNPGLIKVFDTDDFRITKITITKGVHQDSTGNTGANATKTWNRTTSSVLWDKTTNDAGDEWYDETVIWTSEGHTPGETITLDDSTWGDTWKTSGIGEAFLLLFYVEPVEKKDNLTVRYWDDNANKQINPNEIQISVKEGVTFINGIQQTSPVNAGTFTLDDNATIENSVGVSRGFNKNITILDGVAANYRSGIYEYVSADISDDGKTLTLHYNLKKVDNVHEFVVDFGLPVNFTDLLSWFNVEDVTTVDYLSVSKTSKLTVSTGSWGSIKIDENTWNSMTYTLDKMLSAMATIPLYCKLKNGTQLETQIHVIPASNVYYEDSFARFDNGAGAAAAATWGKVGTEKTGVYQALEELGGKTNVYGYDAAYDNCTMFSMGSAHTVNVTSDMAANWNSYADSAWPTATFTFKGTGFDIISLTDNTSGAIFVDVVKTATGTAVKNLLVDNYYGYKQEGNTWVVDPTASDTLYQIPVMKVTGLDYDEYTVTIKVAYSSYFDHTQEGTNYNFWLDAIRVYDPMGENAEYTKDGEGYPQYIKLRDAIAKDGTATVNEKLLFIDGAENATVATYANYGPNNEVYLAKGQAITFNVQGENIASVQIGAKAPKGTAKMSVGGTETSIGTATEMYYTISNAGGQFTITNTGDSILSLTNLKITFTQNSTASLAALTTQEQNDAVMAVRALFTVAPEPFEPSRFEASWNRTTVRAGQKATLIVKTSEDVDAITVNGQTITTFRVRTERTGWGWWSSKVTYREFTYSVTPTETTDYAVAAVNAEGVASEPQTFRLTVSNRGFGGWLKDLFRF